MTRQRHNQDGKRGDKRSFRAPAKTKLDIFSSKAGMGSSDSTFGGNNILGMESLYFIVLNRLLKVVVV